MKKKPKLWYAIADGGRARFVECDENGAFRTVASFVSKDLHSRSSDLGTDRPGRVMESATTGRSAMEPRKDPKEAAKEDFVRLVADELASEHEKGAFDELMLVAPAGVLTDLKQHLAKPLAQLVVRDLQKDLTNVPDHELSAHLSAR
jgi:protein required for attachment to host cells